MPAAFASAPTNTPEIWLQRMNLALRNLNYEGTFVYIRADHLETMHIAHRADDKGGIERLISLTGPKREVIRDHQEVKCILPESHSVLVERRYTTTYFPAVMPAAMHAGALAAHYTFKDLGEGRIAGYKCHIISIEPRDGYRYGYRLWLDARTAMLLRSDLLAEDGQTVERVMFTSLAYPKHIPSAALKATEIEPGYTWNSQGDPEKPRSNDKSVSWKATRLPPGFALARSDVQRVAGVAHPVRHLVYSDGLTSVSVFAQATASAHKFLIGPSHMGAVNAFGRWVGDRHITVIGEVPLATVELIAESMQPEQNP
ncbi:MAG: MucB/RseB C-terminal domain-containing protein [Gammaproteobacteria bacterium]|nr:MucB/RseB C-terminal domain-containing protein [Gammaproteobacteria bacterium]